MFEAVRNYAKFIKSYSKVRVIGVISNRYIKQLKQICFSKLLRYNVPKMNKNGVNK
jgi:hypothetical protein